MQTIDYTVTPQEMELLKHTIGYGLGGYRNFFATTKDAPEIPQLNHLVALGLMSRHIAPAWSGDDFLYMVTPDGREAVRMWATTQDRYRQLIRNLRLIKEGKRKFLILEVQDELKTQSSKQ